MRALFSKLFSIAAVTLCTTLVWLSMSTGAGAVAATDGHVHADVRDIHLAHRSSICGAYHTWQVTQIVQECDCVTEGIYLVTCTVCEATGTVYENAPGHNFVNGVCTVCGELLTAPVTELSNWDYRLDSTAGTIALTNYKGAANDVIVYGKYNVDDIDYLTVLNSESFSSSPFFSKRNDLTSIVIYGGVTSTICNGLFSYCRNLAALNVSGLDTSAVTDMMAMFAICDSLTSLDLSSFDTSMVTDMRWMFSADENLTELDLSNFDTSSVASFHMMFAGCNDLSSLDTGSFDTTNGTSFNYMFYNCYSLDEVDVSNYNTANAVSASNMFAGCTSLTSLDLTSFETSAMRDMTEMFSYSSNLATIYVDGAKWDTSLADTTSMFDGCGTASVTPVI